MHPITRTSQICRRVKMIMEIPPALYFLEFANALFLACG